MLTCYRHTRVVPRPASLAVICGSVSHYLRAQSHFNPDFNLVTHNAVSTQVYQSWYNQPEVVLSDQGSTNGDSSDRESTAEEEDIIELSSSLADLNVAFATSQRGKSNLIIIFLTVKSII